MFSVKRALVDAYHACENCISVSGFQHFATALLLLATHAIRAFLVSAADHHNLQIHVALLLLTTHAIRAFLVSAAYHHNLQIHVASLCK